jgi:pseudaminic acid synthase
MTYLKKLVSKKPFLIAEMSSNHNGSIVTAKKIIKLAKKYGADAIKLQSYTADSITLNCKKKYFRINKGLWKNKYLWDLYKKAHTPYSWHKELFDFAKKNKIICFSSPFDSESVKILEKFNCPIYKLASFELQDFELIKTICKTGKPIIISTGMANLKEIQKTYNFAKKNGAKEISLLYCVSNYPAKNEDFNINNIKILKKKFNCIIGFSDHSLDNDIVAAAISAGAQIIEKHFTIPNQKKGFDVKFSLKGNKLLNYKNKIHKFYNLMGKNEFVRKKQEKPNLIFRRSIFVVKNVKKNEKFTEKNLRVIRPGHGIAPEHYKKIIKKKYASKFISLGEPLKLNMIK